MKKIILSAVLFTCTLITSHCFAQSTGPDFWTEEARSKALYTTHRNFCNSSTEVFVQIGMTTTDGFCMEINERTATTWENARQICASLGKRLPEFPEWKYACKNVSGLNGMLDSTWEWVSNASMPAATNSIPSYMAVQIAGGYSNCAGASWSISGNWNGSQDDSRNFRCVR